MKLIFLMLSVLISFPLLSMDCPKVTGRYRCPAMPNLEFPQPTYEIDATFEKTDGIYYYKSKLSIAPEIITLIVDGKKHTTLDNKNTSRNYVATCNNGKLINTYSSLKKSGTHETQIWLDNNKDLNILYDFAKGKVLICKKISKAPAE